MHVFGPYIGPYGGVTGHDIAFWVFAFLVLVAIVVGVVLLARSGRHHPGAWWGAPPAHWQPHGPAQALAELDLRYARGEIERADYLQRRADLLGQPLTQAGAGPTTGPSSGPSA